MDSILFYQPASDLTSRAQGRFQADGRMAKASVAQSAVRRAKFGAEPRKSTTPFLRLSQSETSVNIAKAGGQPSVIQPLQGSLVCDLGLSLLMRDNAIIGRDYDEFPDIDDLLEGSKHKRNCSTCTTIATYDNPEDPRTLSIIAQKLHNKRLPQEPSSALALVNQKHPEKSEEVRKTSKVTRPGESQENPIISSDDEDDRNDDRFGDGNNSDDQMDGSTEESSPKAVRGSLSPRREDMPQTTQKEGGEGAKQSLSGTGTEIANTDTGQEPEVETAKPRTVHQSSALSKPKSFKGYGKYTMPPIAVLSASLSQSAAELDYVRRLSREQRDQYALFFPKKKVGIHVEPQQQTVLSEPCHGPSSGANELQPVASIETEPHSLSTPAIDITAVIQASDNPGELTPALYWTDFNANFGIDERGSSTEPATPCFCEGGSGDCGARQHKSIEERSVHQPSVNPDAIRVSRPNKPSAERSRATSESSPQPEPLGPPRQRSCGAPEPSPLPDEFRYSSSVDMNPQRNTPARKRSCPVAEDRLPLKRSRRTRKETWKVREAREMAAILDVLD